MPRVPTSPTWRRYRLIHESLRVRRQRRAHFRRGVVPRRASRRSCPPPVRCQGGRADVPMSDGGIPTRLAIPVPVLGSPVQASQHPHLRITFHRVGPRGLLVDLSHPQAFRSNPILWLATDRRCLTSASASSISPFGTNQRMTPPITSGPLPLTHWIEPLRSDGPAS